MEFDSPEGLHYDFNYVRVGLKNHFQSKMIKTSNDFQAQFHILVPLNRKLVSKPRVLRKFRYVKFFGI